MGCGGSSAKVEDKTAAKYTKTEGEESPKGGKTGKGKKKPVPVTVPAVVFTCIFTRTNKEVPFGVALLSPKRNTSVDDFSTGITPKKKGEKEEKDGKEKKAKKAKKTSSDGEAESGPPPPGMDEESLKLWDYEGPSVVPTKPIKNFSFSTITKGNKGRLKVIRLSHDGSILLSASSDEKVLWCSDVKSNEVVLTFEGHDQNMVDAVLGSDNKQVLTAGRDLLLITWDALTAKKSNITELESLPLFIRISPDNKRVLVGHQNNQAIIYDAQKGGIKVVFEQHTKLVVSGCFSPDGIWCLTGDVNGGAFLWNSATGAERCPMTVGNGPVINCQFSADGKVALTHCDQYIHLWDVRSGQPQLTIPLDREPIRHLPLEGKAAPFNPVSPKNRTKDSLRNQLACFVCNGYILRARNDRKFSLLDPQTGLAVLEFTIRNHLTCAHSTEEIFTLAPDRSRSEKYGGMVVDYGKTIITVGDQNGNIYKLTLTF